MKVNSLILMYGFVLGVLSFCYIAKSAVPNDPFLGISPQDENYYKISSNAIKCKDGSKKFTKAQLNDDFCDCPDGTDEPGTSACPAGKFHCRNAGHIPLLLFSSRVNDGICDCCDGSDEYDGRLKCQNTCWEDGKVARDKLRKKIATYKEGVVLRKQYIEKAKQAIAKDEAELSKLRNGENILKRLVEQLKERKEQIEKEEERERLQKEKEEKETKEAEEMAEREKGDSVEEAKQEKGQAMEKTNVEDESSESIHDDTIGVLDDSPLDQDVAGEYASHVADAEQSDNSKNKGSPVNEVEQHVVKEEEESFSPKSVADSDASKIEGSLGNNVEQDVVEEEVSVSPKSKDDSAVASKKGHDAGEVSGDQAVKSGNDVSENTEGLSKEELGRLVASRWTGNSEKQTEGLDVAKDSDHEDHEEKEEMAPDMPDEEHDGYDSGSDDDAGKYEDDKGQYDDIDMEDDIDVTYDDDSRDAGRFSYKSDDEDELDFSDTTFSTSPSWLEKIQHTVRSILQAVNIFQTPLDKSGAAHVRKEYEESSAKLTKIQSRISSLTQKLKHDFGIEKEFYSFYDQCFESKQNKYVYKVCPFKQAYQESYSLGRWDKFEDSHRVMIFSSGDRCYNGPYRSLKVKLRCGLKNEVTNVVEPSICEYEAILSTPVLCLEEKLKELENKLDLMNKEKSQSHDEL